MNNNTSIHSIISWFTANPKRIFGIDALGGSVTAFLIGVVLAKFQAHFGMPLPILYFLAVVALLFFIYSGCCFLFLKHNFKPYLKAIILANLAYCCITIVLLSYFSKLLTAFGFLYFINEVIVIIGLVFIEKKVYDQLLSPE